MADNVLYARKPELFFDLANFRAVGYVGGAVSLKLIPALKNAGIVGLGSKAIVMGTETAVEGGLLGTDAKVGV